MRLSALTPLPWLSLGALAVLATCCPPAPATPTAPKVAAAQPPAVPVAPPPPSGPPVARTVDTVDHQFGLDVPDPYRWMEGQGNTEFITWLKAQGAYAATQLAAAPGRDALHARIRQLGLGVSGVSNVQIANGRTIYTTLPADAQLGKLATREGDAEKILLDPEKLGSSDVHASLNAYSLSPDGKYVGYVIAMGGGEVGEIHVMNLATGKETADVVDAIWGEFAPSWLPDSKAFFYTQMAKPAGADPMLGMVARYHKLGTPVANDVTVLDHAAPTFKLAPQEFPSVWIDPSAPTWVVGQGGGARSEGHYAVAKVADLDLAGTGKTPWKVVAEYSDAVENAAPRAGRLYFSTYKGAPNRKIMSVPLDAPDLAKARLELADDPQANLSQWSLSRDGLYLVHDVGGLAKLSRWAFTGKPTPIELPETGWIYSLVTDSRRDGATYSLNTWLHPGAFYAFDPKTKKSTPTGLAGTSKVIDDRVVASEVEVASFDGAKVPLSLVHFKDIALDGSHPTVINGYGAYGSSQHAYFNATRLAWLERGGVLAICHTRGGGEKGRAWQDDGSRDKKLNGIRDVIACAEYLVAHEYTTATRLGIEGGSAGGILMGRALVERPDLFAAVHIAVGMTNPLRLLAAPNGQNQIGELGDPATEAGYKSIFAFDPYVHVKPDTAYPSVLFTVGANDHRVVPWMTGKMAARLLASTTSKHPVLIRVEADAGHGIGSTRDQGFAEGADVMAFMFQQFGVPPSDR